MVRIVLSFRQLALKSLILSNPWMELKEAALSNRRISPLPHSSAVPLATYAPPSVSLGLFCKMMKVGYWRNTSCTRFVSGSSILFRGIYWASRCFSDSFWDGVHHANTPVPVCIRTGRSWVDFQCLPSSWSSSHHLAIQSCPNFWTVQSGNTHNLP